MKKAIAYFFVTSLVLACSAPAQSTHSYTGVYARKVGSKLRADLGCLDVLQLSDKKFKYLLSLSRGAPSYNMGESEGIVSLVGNNAVDSIDEFVDRPGDRPCIIEFHFEPGRVIIHLPGDDLTCGWGYHVVAEGTYVKLGNQKPEVHESNNYIGARVLTVAVPKTFFYEDSNLKKVQTAYLIAEDSIRELKESSNAVYTELFNHKKLTLTYGWIARRDLH